MWQLIASAWCRRRHSKILWPINGRYQCQTCNRCFSALEQPDKRTEKPSKVGGRFNFEGPTGTELAPPLFRQALKRLW